MKKKKNDESEPNDQADKGKDLVSNVSRAGVLFSQTIDDVVVHEEVAESVHVTNHPPLGRDRQGEINVIYSYKHRTIMILKVARLTAVNRRGLVTSRTRLMPRNQPEKNYSRN